MSVEDETKQKSAEELLFEFERVFDNVEFHRLVNFYGSQYQPSPVRLTDQEIKDVTKYNTLKELHQDITELHDFYETILSLGAKPYDLEYLYESEDLKCLKRKMGKEAPVVNESVIVNVVEKVLATSGLPSWVFDFSEEEEAECPEYPVLSQLEVDSLLNASVCESEKEKHTQGRIKLKSQYGIEEAYTRLTYEFRYLLALAKKGTFYKELFLKRTLALAQLLAAWGKINEVFR